MLLSTTPSIEGDKIVEYCDVIVAVASLNHINPSVDSFEPALEKVRKSAMNKIRAKAKDLGADAVVGISVDYEFVRDPDGVGLLVLSVSGSAVKLDSGEPGGCADRRAQVVRT